MSTASNHGLSWAYVAETRLAVQAQTELACHLPLVKLPDPRECARHAQHSVQQGTRVCAGNVSKDPCGTLVYPTILQYQASAVCSMWESGARVGSLAQIRSH